MNDLVQRLRYLCLDECDEAAARIQELEKRLEIDARTKYDGIDCRDATIRGLEREKEFAQVIADVDKGIRNEQAALLRECRLALDTLLAQKPALAGFKAGSTTLGNLRASLFEHRPQGVMGDTNAQ